MTPQITEQQFVSIINNIKELSDVNYKLGNQLDCGYIEFNMKVMTNLVFCLEKLMADDDNQWIEYYLWELDFGVNDSGLNIYSDGKAIELVTPSDLYNLLIGKPKYKE